jgi:N-carbamoylputrescine amidase
MSQPAHLARGKREVTVAAMQFACGWDVDANIATAERLVRQAAKQGAQIILIQELFETPYFCIEQDSRHLRLATTVAENKAVNHFSKLARELGVVLPISFFEKANNSYFNSIVIVDADGRNLGLYRKAHIPNGPGYQEKNYFSPGDTGFKVFDTKFARIGVAICWDQWFPETARALALQGAEIILIGYNTPISALALDLNDLCLRAGAYANACWVVGVAKAGVEDGVELIGGSSVINPVGQIVAKATTTGDELVASRIDLDQMMPVRKRWNFLGRRQPQHYGALLEPVTEKETHR